MSAPGKAAEHENNLSLKECDRETIKLYLDKYPAENLDKRKLLSSHGFLCSKITAFYDRFTYCLPPALLRNTTGQLLLGETISFQSDCAGFTEINLTKAHRIGRP